MLLWLIGPVRRVSGRAATALHRIETEDTAAAVFEFTNGALGTFAAATSAYPGYPRRVEVTGREGTIVLEHDQVVTVDMRSSDAAANFETSERDTNPSASSAIVSDVGGHRKLIEDFIEAIRTGGEPRCSGREGRKSVALVEALYESARHEQTVDVN